MDTDRARYVRVYDAAGATEIEVIGADLNETSALVEIQRSTDNGYRIAAVECRCSNYCNSIRSFRKKHLAEHIIHW